MHRIVTVCSAALIIAIIFLVDNIYKVHQEINKMNANIESIIHLNRQVPKTLYNPVDGKCVLVYPDSVVYQKAKKK